MVTYPGLPGPEISDYWSRTESEKRYAPGTSFHIGLISMVSNTGTYVDAPFHRYEGATDLADLPLTSIANLEAVVVRPDPAAGRAVDRIAFEGINVHARAVLVHTGHARLWGTERYLPENHFLTSEAAQLLVEAGAALVGIDSLNIDNTGDLHRPVHSALLRACIPLVEHLCGLEQLPPSGFRFFAVPAPVRQLGSFPVRAFALLPG
jgi:kynurenine formamidase